MPSPKAFLRDVAQFGLDPAKPYTKEHMDNSGRVKSRVTAPVVQKPTEEASADDKHPKKKDSEKKSTTKTESSASHKKSATASSHAKGQQAQGRGETVAPEGTSSVENNVEQTEQKATDQVTSEVGDSDIS